MRKLGFGARAEIAFELLPVPFVVAESAHVKTLLDTRQATAYLINPVETKTYPD